MDGTYKSNQFSIQNKEQNHKTKIQYAQTTTKQQSEGRSLVKEIRAIQLVAVKREKNIAVHDLSQ